MVMLSPTVEAVEHQMESMTYLADALRAVERAKRAILLARAEQREANRLIETTRKSA